MDTIIINFPALGQLEASISNTELFEFSRRQFSSYLTGESEANGGNDIVNIRIRKSLPLTPDFKLSREINFSTGKLEFTKRFTAMDLHYKYKFSEDGVEVNVQIRRRLLFCAALLKRGKYSISHLLFYNAVLFPIFSLLSLFEGYFVLHGSLLRIGERVLLLTGLDGVGKSSLASMLVKSGGVLLSDNFVLYNGKVGLPLTLPVRLDRYTKHTGNVIFDAGRHLEVLFPTEEKTPLEIDFTYLLTIASSPSFADLQLRLDSGKALVINNVADEVSEANRFCGPFLLANQILYGSNTTSSAGLTPCQLLAVPKGELDSALRRILCQVNI